MNVDDVYEYVRLGTEAAKSYGRDDLVRKFDDAMHLGSSALEILGAIQIVLLQEAPALDAWMDRSERERIIQFVDGAYGRHE